jgi:hypothetical protein
MAPRFLDLTVLLTSILIFRGSCVPKSLCADFLLDWFETGFSGFACIISSPIVKFRSTINAQDSAEKYQPVVEVFLVKTEKWGSLRRLPII